MAEHSKLTFRFHYPDTPAEAEAAVKMLIRFAAECVSNKISEMCLTASDENDNIDDTCSA